MRIRVLYFSGCPNHQAAVELARQAAAALGVHVQVEEVEVSSGDDAAGLRFLGSPTIQVEGVDVEPAARIRTDYGFSCRTYGGRGLPSRELIVEALLEAADSADGEGGCCAPRAGSGGEISSRHGAGLWTAGGSVASAMASSACCWLPLLLVTFGVSAGGGSAALERYRPLLLGATAVLLATGFYLAYLRRPACGERGACTARSARLRRVNRVVVWVAAAAAIAFAAFPTYVGHLFGRGSPVEATVQAAGLATMTTEVDGMTCEGCAALIESRLGKLPGVHGVTVSYPEGRATVIVDRQVVADDAPLAGMVEDLGYELRGFSFADTRSILESEP